MEKVTKKKKVTAYMWVIECPKCGRYLASACEKNLLPSFAYCDCDRLETITQPESEE